MTESRGGVKTRCAVFASVRYGKKSQQSLWSSSDIGRQRETAKQVV